MQGKKNPGRDGRDRARPSNVSEERGVSKTGGTTPAFGGPSSVLTEPGGRAAAVKKLMAGPRAWAAKTCGAPNADCPCERSMLVQGRYDSTAPHEVMDP